jgi:hypothetical protein
MLICIFGPDTSPSSTAILTPRGAPPRVTHGGEAGIERRPRMRDALQQCQTGRSGKLAHDSKALKHDMHMAVDHAGKQRPPVRVDNLCTVGQTDLLIPPNGNDATVLHEDGRISDRLTSGTVNQGRAANSARTHACAIS